VRYGGVTIRRHGYQPYSAEQLCKTKRGSWFLFDPESSKIAPCNEAYVKDRLANDQEVYRRVFGNPETA
jgi:hypothetical protein